MNGTIEKVTIRTEPWFGAEWTPNTFGGADFSAAPVRLVEDDGEITLHVFTPDRARLLVWSVTFSSGTPAQVVDGVVREAIRNNLRPGWEDALR